MIVVDASVAVKWSVAEKGDATAKAILQRGESLIAPDFVTFATLNVLRRKCKQGSIGVAQYQAAARDLGHYFDRLVSATELVEHAVELAIKLDHAVYDCAYVACAIRENVTVITADDAFVRKAAAHGFQAHAKLL